MPDTHPNTQHDQVDTLRSLNSTSASTGNNSLTRVYAITSGKGGVGKTALTVNTAVSLARQGKSVLIIDADLGLANIDIVLGLTPRYNLNHFFSGEQELDAILIEGPSGVKILPAGSGIQSFIRLDSEHKMRLIDGLEQLNRHFDFVLIDTEAGISENVVYFNTAAQEILVVTTPEPTAITDAYALMKLLSTRYHEKRFNLVVNQIENDHDALDVYRKLTMVASRYLDISIDFLGSIPSDRQMGQAVRKQQPLVVFDPDSATSNAFAELAELLINCQPSREPKGSVQFFWQNLLNFKGENQP